MSGDGEGASRLLLCLRTEDGDTVWTKSFTAEKHDKHGLNSYASSTPVVDAEKVYVAVVTPESQRLLAFSHDGEEKWQRELGPFISRHGCGASPILFEDKLVFPSEQHGEGKSFLIALDKNSGKPVWRAERRTESVSYSTPCVFTDSDGRTQLIFNSSAQRR